jgi:chemotaxis protein MotA
MGVVTIISMVFAFACIIIGFVVEGGSIIALLQPTAALIVIGGTLGAVGMSFPLKTLKKAPKLISISLNERKVNLQEKIEYYKQLSQRARKEGLLSLEAEGNNGSIDAFTREGIDLLFVSQDQDDIRKALELKVEQMYERHQEGIELFSSAGGYAPTMGIVGTITSLVIILSNLNDSSVLGAKIAVAFVATLYGLGTANLIWLPIASKLKELNKQEVIEKQLCTEALIMIYNGVSPDMMEGKLRSFLEENVSAAKRKQY